MRCNLSNLLKFLSMIDQLLEIAKPYGIIGFVLLGAGYVCYTLIKYMERRDRECNASQQRMIDASSKERIEWRQVVQSQHQEAIAMTGHVSDALVDTAKAITDLSTLIRDRK